MKRLRMSQVRMVDFCSYICTCESQNVLESRYVSMESFAPYWLLRQKYYTQRERCQPET